MFRLKNVNKKLQLVVMCGVLNFKNKKSEVDYVSKNYFKLVRLYLQV